MRRGDLAAAAGADELWTRLAGAHERHPRAFVASVTALAFAVRVAATPFDAPVGTDVYALALKALEITRGDPTPIRSHAIGWSIVLAPFLALAPPAPFLAVLNIVRLVACGFGALAVIPFALIARETLPPRSRLFALALVPFALLLVRVAVRGFAEPLLTLALLGATAGVLIGQRSRLALAAGAVCAGFACSVHPTGVVVPVLAVVVLVATRSDGGRLLAAGQVAAIAIVVALPAAVQRARAFGHPMDFGFNNRFFAEHSEDLWSVHLTAPTLGEYVRRHSWGGVVDRLIVRGAGSELWDFVTDVVHVPVLPFLAYGCWLGFRSPRLRPVVVALAVFLLSWVPVYELFGNGRHLAPALPFALLLVAAGVGTLAGRRRHAGAWMLALAVTFAVGESVAAGVQRQRVLRDESVAGLEWGRWAADHVRGRLALTEGHQLVMMHLPDATVSGVDILSMYAPRTGLALVRPGDFPTLAEAFGWMRAHGVTHVLVDGRHDVRTSLGPLISARALPAFLAERYASGPGSRWPVRIFEIRWERYDPAADASDSGRQRRPRTAENVPGRPT